MRMYRRVHTQRAPYFSCFARPQLVSYPLHSLFPRHSSPAATPLPPPALLKTRRACKEDLISRYETVAT